MDKKQKALSSELSILIFLCVVILVCFLLFVPKVASTLFPWKRQMILSNFLQHVSQAKTIPPQVFWEFREFYSPGYYTFNRNGLSQPQIAAAKQYVTTPLTANNVNIFLSFTSPHLHSIEALVTQNSLGKVIDTSFPHKQVLLSNSQEMVWKDTKGDWYVVFIKPISEMKTANGYFDYNGQDKELVRGKYWLDITRLDGR